MQGGLEIKATPRYGAAVLIQLLLEDSIGTKEDQGVASR